MIYSCHLHYHCRLCCRCRLHRHHRSQITIKITLGRRLSSNTITLTKKLFPLFFFFLKDYTPKSKCKSVFELCLSVQIAYERRWLFLASKAMSTPRPCYLQRSNLVCCNGYPEHHRTEELSVSLPWFHRQDLLQQKDESMQHLPHLLH